MMQKTRKMTEPLTHGYSSESTQRELSNECHHDRAKVVIKNLCVIVLWIKSNLSIGRVKGVKSLPVWDTIRTPESTLPFQTDNRI